MVLAESNHHAAPRGQKMARTREEVEPEQHEVPRRPEPRSPGVWPSSVAEPGPQRSDGNVRHSSGEAPLLALPVAATVSEVVDSSALSWIVDRALSEQRRAKDADGLRHLQEPSAHKWWSCRSRTRRGLRGWRRGKGRGRRGGRRSSRSFPPRGILLTALRYWLPCSVSGCSLTSTICGFS